MTEPSLGGSSALNSKFKSVLAKSKYDEDLFWKGFKRSLTAHSTLAIALILLSYISMKEPVRFTPSIRVDLVGLPDIKKSDLDKMKMDQFEDPSKAAEKEVTKKFKEEKAKPAKKEEAEFSIKKDKRSKSDPLKSAIDRIKALEKIENEVKAQSKKKAQLKGNILSKGNALSGDATQDTDAYIGQMQTRLRENWNLPIWLTRQNLSAKAVIFLGRAGQVTNVMIAQSSGNAQFDDYVLKTIKQAQPFGPPPSEVLDGGITLGFPL